MVLKHLFIVPLLIIGHTGTPLHIPVILRSSNSLGWGLLEKTLRLSHGATCIGRQTKILRSLLCAKFIGRQTKILSHCSVQSSLTRHLEN